MRVLIPFSDELIYHGDKETVYRLGGRYNRELSCYEFEQYDLEAYLKVLDGQWYDIENTTKHTR